MMAAVRGTDVGVTINNPLTLGETQLSLFQWVPNNSSLTALPLRFLNLHQNENCSVVAAKALVQLQGAGSVFYFNKTLSSNGWPTRNVTFQLKGVQYSFDPNRMFTAAGLASNLWPYSANAAAEVLAFSQRVLALYAPPEVGPFQWVAIHNNALSGGLSAAAYLPGAVYGNDASAVNIGSVATPKEFFLLTDSPNGRSLFSKLSALGYSAVLQAPPGPNSTLTDDGSLSVYCAFNDIDYVNIESTAPTDDDHEGFHLITQLSLFQTLATLLSSSSSKSLIH